MTTAPKSGVEMIAAERAAQVSREGYDADHDDGHADGSLALAAACYAAPVRIYVDHEYANGRSFVDPWPWDGRHDKRTYKGNVVTPEAATTTMRVRLLAKAGALIAAEIDRLLRLDGGPL